MSPLFYLVLLILAVLSLVLAMAAADAQLEEEPQGAWCPMCEQGSKPLGISELPFALRINRREWLVLPPGWERCRIRGSNAFHLVNPDLYLEHEEEALGDGSTP